jgi:hypothetical protein
VGGFPGKIENRQNFTKKSFGQDIFTPAVNEKWEFAGNVQFVAAANKRKPRPPTLHDDKASTFFGVH